jgi:cell division transport system ATP-binding protein
MSEQTPIIHYADVSLFQQNNLVLSDIQLKILPGEFVYLIGTTGSGKSTLIKSLYGELPVERGTASIAGFDLAKLKKSQIPLLRRKLGVVFQDFQLLFDRDVEDNLDFVLHATDWKNEAERKQRINDVLEMVGLQTKHHKMPHELSGGEQQRLAIARALLNKPEVIIADEPTGNLDPNTSDDILRLLHHISSNGTAILMATHDYRILDQFPSHVIRCEGGKVLVNKLLKQTN